MGKDPIVPVLAPSDEVEEAPEASGDPLPLVGVPDGLTVLYGLSVFLLSWLASRLLSEAGCRPIAKTPQDVVATRRMDIATISILRMRQLYDLL